MFFKCLNVLDICLNGVRNIGGCVRINSLSHTPLACFMSNYKSTHTSLPSLQNRPPYKWGAFGAFMQLHKVLILLCICTLAQKFTFLRLGPKTLKDKLFCSFNEVFALFKFWVLVVIT